ncbi:MAG: hypothetical protein HY589_02705, partial [Candidatus Omnitrophica bacterium]|nr:hypothetical protein [Candidatus Omnitrophota bacterium]
MTYQMLQHLALDNPTASKTHLGPADDNRGGDNNAPLGRSNRELQMFITHDWALGGRTEEWRTWDQADMYAAALPEGGLRMGTQMLEAPDPHNPVHTLFSAINSRASEKGHNVARFVPYTVRGKPYLLVVTTLPHIDMVKGVLHQDALTQSQKEQNKRANAFLALQALVEGTPNFYEYFRGVKLVDQDEFEQLPARCGWLKEGVELEEILRNGVDPATGEDLTTQQINAARERLTYLRGCMKLKEGVTFTDVAYVLPRINPLDLAAEDQFARGIDPDDGKSFGERDIFGRLDKRGQAARKRVEKDKLQKARSSFLVSDFKKGMELENKQDAEELSAEEKSAYQVLIRTMKLRPDETFCGILSASGLTEVPGGLGLDDTLKAKRNPVNHERFTRSQRRAATRLRECVGLVEGVTFTDIASAIPGLPAGPPGTLPVTNMEEMLYAKDSGSMVSQASGAEAYLTYPDGAAVPGNSAPRFGLEHSGLQQPSDEIAQTLSEDGAEMIRWLRRKAGTELDNDEACDRWVRYFTDEMARRQDELSIPEEDRLDPPTRENVRDLKKLSDEFVNTGNLMPNSEDAGILYRLFGLTKDENGEPDYREQLSGFYDKSTYTLVTGPPYLPAKERTSVPIKKKGYGTLLERSKNWVRGHCPPGVRKVLKLTVIGTAALATIAFYVMLPKWFVKRAWWIPAFVWFLVAQSGALTLHMRPVNAPMSLFTMHEPPWSAPVTGLNLLLTDFFDVWQRHGEDTLLGIFFLMVSVWNPATPAVSAWKMEYVIGQLEEVLSDNAYQRGLGIMKGLGMRYA